MIFRKAAHAPDAGDQPPAHPPAEDLFAFAIDRLFWEERQAALRKDYSAARNAEIKRVILQEARARAIAIRFV